MELLDIIEAVLLNPSRRASHDYARDIARKERDASLRDVKIWVDLGYGMQAGRALGRAYRANDLMTRPRS